MNWLGDVKVGGKFRWLHNGVVCRVVGVKDHGIQIDFVYETGDQKGQQGYTLLPQDVEPYGVLDQLADIDP